MRTLSTHGIEGSKLLIAVATLAHSAFHRPPFGIEAEPTRRTGDAPLANEPRENVPARRAKKLNVGVSIGASISGDNVGGKQVNIAMAVRATGLHYPKVIQNVARTIARVLRPVQCMDRFSNTIGKLCESILDLPAIHRPQGDPHRFHGDRVDVSPQ